MSTELTEEQRNRVQMSQAEELTMQQHVRQKLRLARNRLAKSWGVEAMHEDDMQILARDIYLGGGQGNGKLPTTPAVQQPTAQPTPQQEGSKPSVLGQLVGPAIGAGTLAAGLGLGSWLLGDKPEPATQPTPAVGDADRDWKASAYVSKPE